MSESKRRQLGLEAPVLPNKNWELDPLGAALLVKVDDPEKMTAGGILVPQSAQASVSRLAGLMGVIQNVGPDVEDKRLVSGARIMWWAGASLQLTKSQVVVTEDSVIGILEEGPAAPKLLEAGD